PYRTYTWDAAALADEWTGADLNDPSFGLSFAGKRTGEYNTVTAVIAHVQMTASYELVGRIPSNPTFYDWTRPPP
ncbi:MAG: hypothetical protein NTW61_03195, partial [Candidatus Melainabacteria bacterium]|nr:hypothetical protein [Candidatus Melainabacteria bacterium]